MSFHPSISKAASEIATQLKNSRHASITVDPEIWLLPTNWEIEADIETATNQMCVDDGFHAYVEKQSSTTVTAVRQANSIRSYL